MDELLAFLSEFDDSWKVCQSGRYIQNSPLHPDGYFQFTFDKVDALGNITYGRPITIDIPVRCTHCSVRISTQFAAHPPPEWTSTNASRIMTPGRPPGIDIGQYSLTKQIQRPVTKVLLRDAYRPQLHEAIARLPMSGLERAQEEFAKAGPKVYYQHELGIKLPFIEIRDTIRWGAVSSMQKAEERLPTTTNCLESINGHRNEDTPRRNTC